MSRTTISAPATPEMKARFSQQPGPLPRAVDDVSQEELSFRASLHRTELSLLERGERMPRVDTALRIAASLGVLIQLAGTYSTSAGDLANGITWRPGWVEHSESAEYLVSDDQPDDAT